MRRCPSLDQLFAAVLGRASDGESAEFFGHAENCRRCARVLASAPDPENLEAGLRELEAARQTDQLLAADTRTAERRATTTLFGEE